MQDTKLFIHIKLSGINYSFLLYILYFCILRIHFAMKRCLTHSVLSICLLISILPALLGFVHRSCSVCKINETKPALLFTHSHNSFDCCTLKYHCKKTASDDMPCGNCKKQDSKQNEPCGDIDFKKLEIDVTNNFSNISAPAPFEKTLFGEFAHYIFAFSDISVEFILNEYPPPLFITVDFSIKNCVFRL